jgi:hypothetical protein
MLPNRFPDQGQAPEYNTVDATLWYVDAIRAYVAATDDDATLRALFPVLEDIVQWHRQGTRYGIKEDPSDSLLRAGRWRPAHVDGREGRDWPPRRARADRPSSHNAVRSMAWPAVRSRPRPGTLGDKIKRGFDRFWHRGCSTVDVLTARRLDDALQLNQIFAVSLKAASERRVADVCGRHLPASWLAEPGEIRYCAVRRRRDERRRVSPGRRPGCSGPARAISCATTAMLPLADHWDFEQHRGNSTPTRRFGVHRPAWRVRDAPRWSEIASIR